MSIRARAGGSEGQDIHAIRSRWPWETDGLLVTRCILNELHIDALVKQEDDIQARGSSLLNMV